MAPGWQGGTAGDFVGVCNGREACAHKLSDKLLSSLSLLSGLKVHTFYTTATSGHAGNCLLVYSYDVCVHDVD